MAPLISVIMPVYNGEKTLRDSVASVLAQTLADFELIAVNDGSTDGSAALLRRMAEEDGRVRVIDKENGGVSSARNAALERASGEYLAFIDCDDFAEPQWLEKLAGAAGTGGQLAVCGYSTTQRGSLDVGKTTELKAARLGAAEALARTLTYRDLTSALWNKLFLRRLVGSGPEMLRFREDFAIGEDLLFITAYCLRMDGDAVLVPEALYRYRTGTSSAMRDIGRGGFRESWLSEWRAVLEAERALAERGLTLKEIRVKKVRIAGKLLQSLKKGGGADREEAREMKRCLRKNLPLILTEREYSKKMKLNMLLSML